MLERNILIVDDNQLTETIYIPSYINIIEDLKNSSQKWKQYSFNLFHKASMKDALSYLSDIHNYVDVIVVDYMFNGEDIFSSGTAFVKHVRESINRHCQIVFYTMQGVANIDNDELIDLINSDVYKLVDKSKGPDELVRVLYEASTLRNPIVESLECFFLKYKNMLDFYRYTIDGDNVSVEEIINHIRMDDTMGRKFIEKLLQKAILLDINIEV